MFVVTLFTGIFIGLQWWEIRTGSIDTHELALAAKSQATNTENLAKSSADQVAKLREQVDQLKRSADETHALAASGREANRNAISAFQLDERPWVSASRFLLSQEPTGDNESTISIWMSNSGKTPALNISPWSKVSVWIGEPPVFSIKDIPTENKLFSRSTLPPGPTDSHFITDPIKVRQAPMVAYKSGQSHIYVQAGIRYTDSVNKSDWTTICISHGFGKPLNEFMYCNQGNDMDHEQ